jgi:hypothetical protein
MLKKVVFSERAFNAVITESYDKQSTETGGILLGRIIDNVWYILESIDPGPKSIFEVAYFEYDTDYVNYLSNVISFQYKIELSVLGLWHRHPGSFDTFSSTDDITNKKFSEINNELGAISCLVNIDPNFRFTVYHVSNPLKYTKIDFISNDEEIPQILKELKYENIVANHKTFRNNTNFVKRILKVFSNE